MYSENVIAELGHQIELRQITKYVNIKDTCIQYIEFQKNTIVNLLNDWMKYFEKWCLFYKESMLFEI